MPFKIDLFYSISFPLANDMKYIYIYNMRHEIRRHNPAPKGIQLTESIKTFSFSDAFLHL